MGQPAPCPWRQRERERERDRERRRFRAKVLHFLLCCLLLSSKNISDRAGQVSDGLQARTIAFFGLSRTTPPVVHDVARVKQHREGDRRDIFPHNHSPVEFRVDGIDVSAHVAQQLANVGNGLGVGRHRTIVLQFSIRVASSLYKVTSLGLPMTGFRRGEAGRRGRGGGRRDAGGPRRRQQRAVIPLHHGARL